MPTPLGSSLTARNGVQANGIDQKDQFASNTPEGVAVMRRPLIACPANAGQPDAFPLHDVR
jgi:hypothetical protein